MKTYAILLLAVVSTGATADQFVNGYVRQDGTVVAPHIRTAPNNVQYDNYSTKGNTNPYTGQRGTQSDQSYSPGPYGYDRSTRKTRPYQ